MIKSKLKYELDVAEELFPSTRFSSRKLEIQAYKMAVANSIEIVNSIELRFITGGGRDMKAKTIFTFSSVDELFKDV